RQSALADEEGNDAADRKRVAAQGLDRFPESGSRTVRAGRSVLGRTLARDDQRGKGKGEGGSGLRTPRRPPDADPEADADQDLAGLERGQLLLLRLPGQ